MTKIFVVSLAQGITEAEAENCSVIPKRVFKIDPHNVPECLWPYLDSPHSAFIGLIGIQVFFTREEAHAAISGMRLQEIKRTLITPYVVPTMKIAEPKPMIIYVTKYGLTRGIIRIENTHNANSRPGRKFTNSFIPELGSALSGTIGVDIHYSKVDAEARLEVLRQREIAKLKKKLAKLEAMQTRFTTDKVH